MNETKVYGPVPTGFRLLGAAREFAALILLEQMLRDDLAVDAGECGRPERRRLRKGQAHAQRVDLLRLDVLVDADRRRRCRRVGGVLPVKDDIVGGEGLPVVPFDVGLQLPDDRLTVGGDVAVLEARHLGGQDWHQDTVGVPGRQRLVEDARGILILCADREMRVEQGRRFPPQRLQRAAAAGLGRRIGGLRRRLGQPGIGQEQVGERRRQAKRNHPSHKGPPGHLSSPDRRDQASKFSLVHRTPLQLPHPIDPA